MRSVYCLIFVGALLALPARVVADPKSAKLPFSAEDEKTFIEAGMIIEYDCYQHSYLGSGPESPYTEYLFILCTDGKGYDCERWTAGWDGRMLGGIKCESSIVRREWGDLGKRLPEDKTTVEVSKKTVKVEDTEYATTLYRREPDKGDPETQERFELNKEFPGVPLRYSKFGFNEEWRATLQHIYKGDDAARWRENHLPCSPWTAASAAKFLIKDLSWGYKVSGPRKGRVSLKVVDADADYVELEQVSEFGDVKETTQTKRRFADAAPYVPCLFTSLRKKAARAKVNGKDEACRQYTMTSKAGRGWPQVWIAVDDMPLIYASMRNQTKADPTDDDEFWELESVNVPKKK